MSEASIQSGEPPALPADAPLLVRGVSRKFGRVHANRDVSLAVPAASVVGLLGPNGAGKTTLVRICAGWLRPDAGSVRIDGMRQRPGARAPKRRLGIVSGDAPLHPELTVAETLRLRAALHGLVPRAAGEACDRALAEFGLAETASRQVRFLSTGQTQRVRIACAALHEPAVVLLDEPTASLDPEMRRVIWAHLEALKRRGTAILMCTHDLHEAAALCETVHLLVGGALVCSMGRGAVNGEASRLEHEYLTAVRAERETRRP